MINMFFYFMKLSVKSLVVIPLIILVRFLIRKQPKIYSYALWAVVFAGLLLNIRIALPSLPPAISTVGVITNSVDSRYAELLDDYVGGTNIYHSNTLEYYDAIEKGITPVSDGTGGGYVVTGKDSVSPPQTVGSSVMPMLAVVWTVGVITALFILLKNLVDFHARLAGAIKQSDDIYFSPNITSPFVYGIIKPRIYIPLSMGDNLPQQIILHERTHIRRCDHIVKPLCLLIAVLHWFNPLVWLAFSLMCQDMEMSCDEKVIAGTGGKKAYSLRLLNCAVDKHTNPVRAVLFGESKTENRIKNILDYKQPAKLVSMLLTAVVAICFTACMVEEKVDEIIPTPTPAPKTFYEQLAEVNSTENVQYKERVLVENITRDTIKEENYYRPEDLPETYNRVGLPYEMSKGYKFEKDGKAAYSYSYIPSKKTDKMAVHIWKYDSSQFTYYPIGENETFINFAGGWEQLSDELAFFSYITEDENGEIWLNIHKVNTQGFKPADWIFDSVRHQLDKNNYFKVRGLRFRNENVGFMGQTDRGYIKDDNSVNNPAKYETPQANITIDGGKTWHKLDFSQLVYPSYFTGYRGCCMTMVGDRVEFRYFTDLTENARQDVAAKDFVLRSANESYSIISEDGGLTWAGFLKRWDYDAKEYVYIQVTDTIPVQIID